MTDGTDPSQHFPVQLGVWTNWSRGKVLGATLTLNRKDADLLIAFTAFFIAFVASRTWRILCFVLHRVYSKTTPQNAIYHQRQAILRNSSSPEAGVLLLLYTWWANRHFKSYMLPLPAALVAILCLGAFTVAGGLSSRISASVGDEVLLESANCGHLPVSDDFTPSPGDPYIAERYDNAANYAQQCYSNTSTGILDCARFVTRRISAAFDKNAPCPFKNNTCRTQSGNLQIDSGYIDSHEHLGLNAPVDMRIWWRYVLHCAPLVTAGYTSQKNTSVGDLTVYHYGSVVTQDYVYAMGSVESQYAFELSNDTVETTAGYRLGSLVASVKNGKHNVVASDFIPALPFTREDADLSLLFLSGNGVWFSEPTDDEWYHSSKIGIMVQFAQAENTSSGKLYQPQEPASPLGCTSQYQFCNPALPEQTRCGRLASVKDAIADAAALFGTYEEYAAGAPRTEAAASFLYFVYALTQSGPGVSLIVTQQGPKILLSQKTILDFVQGRIEPDQWQLDVANIWNTSMALVQSIFVEMAYNPNAVAGATFQTESQSPPLKKLCNSQKIRSSAYASLSVFGVLFTYITGLLLVLTSYLLEPVSAFLHNKRGYKQHAHLEWTADATLQLQRLVHEELGLGTWSECTSTIPITREDETLGCLDITDRDHPVFRPLGAETSTQDGAQSPDATDNPAQSEVPENEPMIEPSASQDDGSTIEPRRIRRASV